MQKTALVTGYTGQDGTFLTEHLLKLGYKVVGLCRRISTEPPHRVRGFDFQPYIDSGSLVLEQGDLLSVNSLIRIIENHLPDEVYNLAAQSHVATSFNQPEFTIEADFLGVVNLITALESCEASYHAVGHTWKMYQASTSEMFGDKQIGTQLDETSIMDPNSPYSIAKMAAHQYCHMKRMQGRFIACGILFNHESEIRGGDFVTQKICKAVAQRLIDPSTVFQLGNIDSCRDWGYAGDYVMAMHYMLQHEKADDFVIATGQTHTVREFLESALRAVDKSIKWEGEGMEEVGFVDGTPFVSISPKYYRKVDVRYLNGNAEKAFNDLGWSPIVNFDELVEKMVKAQVNQ